MVGVYVAMKDEKASWGGGVSKQLEPCGLAAQG